ncbi:hypothetical protein [Desulfosarcina widdelii]|nr:hypothetical protein [Desulfosarcina widdelii]
MIEKPFFVILNHQNGSVLPMVENDDGDLAMFETETDAVTAGNNNPLGEHYGFEVFELGDGRCFGC